jgi:type IV pilus assembly protein PilO
MGDILDNLSKLSGLHKVLGALGIYLLVAALLYFPLIKATQDRVVEGETLQQDLKEEKRDFQKTAQDKETWRKQVETLNKKLAKAYTELPDARQIPDLIRRISTIGKKIGLEFLLFRPLPETKQEFYAEVPIQMKVEGSYHDVATFFDRLGKFPRIVNVRDIRMHTPVERSGRMILTIEGTAVTYRFLSDEEKEAAQGQRRRR